MAKKDEKTWTLITSVFRMSFPHLIKARQYENKGDFFYSTDQIYNEEDLAKFRLLNDKGEFEVVNAAEICKQIAADKWPGKKLAELFPNMKGWPIIKGDKLAAKAEAKGKDGEAYKGKLVIKSKTKAEYAPSLYLLDGKKKTALRRDSEQDMAVAKDLFVGGHYAYAEVKPSARTVDEDNHITFYLNGVVFVKRGEKLGKGSALDRFDGIEGGAADFDPTEGISDDLGADSEFSA